MLKVRHLQVRVQTPDVLCGTSIDFENGLNILRADNSSGKSTCLQSIIYALGLEGMLSAKREVPLPHAMTDSITISGQELPVVESWVALEIENGAGQKLTVRRAVKSRRVDRALIETWPGPISSLESSSAKGQDYFVRRSGAAQRSSGFHRRLAEFLDWRLPQVSRVDGSEGPLYLECLFPFFYVEQKHGWTGIQARIPTYFGIRDVGKRSAEFILDLDAYSLILQRQRLEGASAVMEREWKEVVSRLHTSTELANVRLRGVPEKPIDGVSPDQADLIVPNADDWFSIQAEIDRIRDSLAESEYIDVRTVGETAADLEERLSKAQTDLATTQALLSNTLAEVRETRARQVSLQRRITALEEDLQRHKDAALLRQLGSVHTSILNDSAICPTCQQQLVDGFEITDHPMTAEESIAHIQQELRTFKAMENDLFRHESAEQIKSRRLREDTAQLRRQIRSIKDALTSPSATPSVDRLTERLKEQERLEALIRIRDEVDSHMADLANRSIAWGNNQEALRALSGSQRTPQDSQKIQYLRRVFVDQLRAYHFGSIEPAHVEVSEETYRPTYEGFDLGFDLSASDMIRVIWAYLLGFLETGMAFNSNHPYLLMFDEPRQQETKEMSFQALLARAAADGAEGAQIIFATSWPEVPLEKMLAGLPHHLISERPDTKILRALASG